MIRAAPRFAELAAATNFSFLRGASHPEEMVAQAARLGLFGLGIADRNSLAGVVRAHVFARENKAAVGALRVVTGARLAFADGAPDILAYPGDRAAYGRLSRLLTKGNLRAPKGQCHLTIDDLFDHAEGLRIVVMEGAAPGEQPRAAPVLRCQAKLPVVHRPLPRDDSTALSGLLLRIILLPSCHSAFSDPRLERCQHSQWTTVA